MKDLKFPKPMSDIWFNRYLAFIESRSQRKISAEIERHHILPKSLGGSNAKENIVVLSYREHYIAHLLLYKSFGGKMAHAFKLMSILNTGCKLSSRQFKEIKEESSKAVKSWMTGRPVSNSTREKLSAVRKGVPHSTETKVKISEGHKGKPKSKEARIKMSEALSGEKHPNWNKHLSKETRLKISKSKTGKPLSEDHKISVSKTLTSGVYITPFGRFEGRNIAVKEINSLGYNISASMLCHYCESGGSLKRIYRNSGDLFKKCDIGKSYFDLGWYREKV